MKKNTLFFYFLIVIFSYSLLSCSDSENISDKKLLPSQIKQNYSLNSASPGSSVRIVDNYTYDESNRLINISQAYTHSSTDNERINTKNTIIKYDDEGRILETNITSSENSAIGVVFIDKYSYDGDNVNIKRDGKDFASIRVSAQNIVLTYALVGESREVVTYQLDNKGNVIQYSYVSDNTNQRRYNTDGKNGIFKQVNTPRWFLITQAIFSNYQIENATKEFTFADEKWIEFTYNELQYNNDDYPVLIKTIPSPGWIGTSPTKMEIEYVPAKIITQ